MTPAKLSGDLRGRRSAFAAAALAVLCAAACAPAPPQPKKEDVIARLETETGKKAQTTASGLAVIMVAEGAGESPKLGDIVTVDYTGTLLNGEKFDSSKDRGKPARFSTRSVIKGWQEGLQLMKPGGKAHLIIPPELGYGAEAQKGIPANSTLVFEVELIGIEK